MGLLGRAVNIEDGAALATDQDRGFHGLKRVISPLGGLPARGDAVEARGVDRLDSAGLMEANRQPQEYPPDPHLELFLGVTDGREIREAIEMEAELAGDSRHLVEDVHQLPLGVVKVLPKTVQAQDHPVGVATFTRLDGRGRLASDSLFGQRDTPPGEAGYLSYHTRPRPLHSPSKPVRQLSYRTINTTSEVHG